MCGIVGIVAKNKNVGIPYKLRGVFQQMLYVDALRGEDSTGAYVITKDWDAVWAKQASMPEAFIKHHSVTPLFNRLSASGIVAVGHNRKATFGKVDDNNAHPFVEDKVLLVHNGTLKNHKDLNKDVDVDSHAIAHVLKDHGIRKALRKINGAFALAATDLDKGEFYLVRNEERPLYLGETDDAWLFSSEPWVMYGPASREGLTLKNIKQLEPGELYTFTTTEEKEVVLKVSKVKLWADTPAAPPKKLPVVVQKKEPRTPAKGGNDVLGVIERFPKDKLVCFVPKTLNQLVSGKFKITGTTYRSPEIAVEAFIEATTFAEGQKFFNEPLLFGYVRSLSADTQLNTARIYLINIGISDPLMTQGEQITEEDMEQVSGQCHTCGGIIEDDDLATSYYRKRGPKYMMVCPTCLENNRAKNPNWGKGIK